MLPQTEYHITVTSVEGVDGTSATSLHDNALSVSTQFTMPSAAEMNTLNSNALEPAFLKVTPRL